MKLEVLRATEEWQIAGAYSVRIEGMNRQHHISLREEFDEYDGVGTKYIVMLDDGYPIATCRFYELDDETVTLGRVVVLPQYRGQQLGKRVLEEAEKWISELGFKTIIIDSRVEAVGFYEKSGYFKDTEDIERNGVFDCIRMKKSEKYKCPCCGYYTFDKKIRGTYEVCPVCYWEDDPIQLEDETYEGGANKVSLKQARRNFLIFGACEERLIKYVRPPREDELTGIE